MLFFCCTCVIVYCALNRCWCVMCCTFVNVVGFMLYSCGHLSLYFMLYMYKCVSHWTGVVVSCCVSCCSGVIVGHVQQMWLWLCHAVFHVQVWLCHAVFHVVQVWFVMLCFMLYRHGCVMLNRCDWLCHTVCFDVQVWLWVGVMCHAVCVCTGAGMGPVSGLHTQFWQHVLQDLDRAPVDHHQEEGPQGNAALALLSNSPPPPPSVFDQTSRYHFKSMICHDVREHWQDSNQ